MIAIHESKWVIENGEVIDRNMHKEIKDYIEKYNPESLESIKKIEEEIEILKTRGLEINYSLKVDTGWKQPL